MLIKNYLLLIMPSIALALEMIPNAVMLKFTNPEGEIVYRAVSYFNISIFGNPNFGPFIAAILTVVTLIFLIIFISSNNQKYFKSARFFTVLALLFSLIPILIKMYSLIGFTISLALLIEVLLLFNKIPLLKIID